MIEIKKKLERNVDKKVKMRWVKGMKKIQVIKGGVKEIQ